MHEKQYLIRCMDCEHIWTIDWEQLDTIAKLACDDNLCSHCGNNFITIRPLLSATNL